MRKRCGWTGRSRVAIFRTARTSVSPTLSHAMWISHSRRSVPGMGRCQCSPHGVHSHSVYKRSGKPSEIKRMIAELSSSQDSRDACRVQAQKHCAVFATSTCERWLVSPLGPSVLVRQALRRDSQARRAARPRHRCQARFVEWWTSRAPRSGLGTGYVASRAPATQLQSRRPDGGRNVSNSASHSAVGRWDLSRVE
jgi:hypothetical protein